MLELFSYWPIFTFLLVAPVLVGYSLAGGLNLIFSDWMLGILTIGLFLMFGKALDISFWITFFLGLVLLIVGLHLRFKNSFHVSLRVSIPRFRSACIALSCLFLFLLLLSDFVEILAHPLLDWDAIAIYLFKVKALYQDFPFAELPRADRPNLGATLWVLPMKLLGSETAEAVGRFVFPTIFFVAILMHWELVRTNLQAAVLTGTMISASLLFITPVNYTQALNLILNGYQDGLIMSLGGCAGIFFCKVILQLKEGSKSNFKNSLFMALFFSSCLGFVKDEGFYLGLILFSCFFLALAGTIPLHKHRELVKPLAAVLICYLATYAIRPGILMLHGMNTVAGTGFSFEDVFGLTNNFDRLPVIFGYFKNYLSGRQEPIIAAGALSTLAYVLVPRSRGVVIFLVTSWIAHVLFLLVIFLSTPLEYQWHLSTAFYRLSYQHSFVYISAICVLPLLLSDLVADRFRSKSVETGSVIEPLDTT